MFAETDPMRSCADASSRPVELIFPPSLQSPTALAITIAVHRSLLRKLEANSPSLDRTGVQNGHSKNLLRVRLANHAGEEITITSIHGQYREIGGKERTLRNVSLRDWRGVGDEDWEADELSVLPGLASPVIPYKFHSENKIGEVGLRVWVDYLDAGKKSHSVLGYDASVTIVEPPTSWFDLQLLSTYAFLLAFVSFIGYYAFTSYTAPEVTKKGAKGPRPKKVTPVASEEKKDGKSYEEEWIPEQILRQRKKKEEGAGYKSATSGEESEGGAVKKGKGKGRK
ncbi:hypothetical protein P7C70_g9188, partial [Phenoliferia sp. Uapishka_3]